jgi:hypothetical protein
VYLSGTLGRPSPIIAEEPLLPLAKAPEPPNPHLSHMLDSFSYLFYFSNSFFSFINLATVVHFDSKVSLEEDDDDVYYGMGILLSYRKRSADYVKLFLIRY